MRLLPMLAAVSAFAVVSLPVSVQAAPPQEREVQDAQDTKASETEAKDGTQKEDVPAAREEKKADKKVCKRIKKIASRFSERICMSEEEWDAVSDQSKGSTESSRKYD